MNKTKEETTTETTKGTRSKKVTEEKQKETKAKKATGKKTEKGTEKTTKRGGVGGNGNLVPFDQLTEEEQRAIRSKGGKKSVESRRRKKELREFMKDFLMQEASAPLKANMKTVGVETDQMTNLAAMCTRLFTKAVSTGDLNAARTIIEWAGMAPLQQERENEAIARMGQVLQMANGDDESGEEEETVVFYIPQNGRDVLNGDNLVTIEES